MLTYLHAAEYKTLLHALPAAIQTYANLHPTAHDAYELWRFCQFTQLLDEFYIWNRIDEETIGSDMEILSDSLKTVPAFWYQPPLRRCEL